MIAFQYIQITATLVASARSPASVGDLANCHAAAIPDLCDLPELPVVANVAAAFHLLGDMNLLRGEAEAAEECYRRGLRAGSGLPHAQAWSCRAAGMQALFRNRLETAAACFHRLLSNTDYPIELLLEAKIIAALIHHETGARMLARRLMQSVCMEASAPSLGAWQRVAGLVSNDFSVHAALRDKIDMADDIHSRSIDDDGRIEMPPVSSRTDAEPADDIVQLLMRRERQIDMLCTIATDPLADSTTVQAVLQSIGTQIGLQCREVTILEMAEAALSMRNGRLAEILLSQLKPPPTPGAHIPVTATQRQHLYCLSKLRVLQGRFDEGFSIYRLYAGVAMQLMRDHQIITNRYAGEVSSKFTAAHDEVSVRLPPRYRRAYQYMVAHMRRPDLSISEIAIEIGVTERALQLAFREHIDLSPREVLRRLRMRRIHEELTQGDADASLMDVAIRFGVQNRASLLSGYRRYYDETPSATRMRRP